MKPDYVSSPSAQSQLYALLNCKAETRKLIQSVGSLLEECMPSAAVWILKTEDSEETAESVYRSSNAKDSELDLRALPPFLSKIHHDTRISSIQTHPAGAELRELFPTQEITAATIHRIRPRNSHAWGYIFVLFRSAGKEPNVAEEALMQGDLWVQFAATILERRVLEERLQTVETRLDLAMKAGGLGIFDWEVHTNHLYWTPQTYLIHDVDPLSWKPSYDAWQNLLPKEEVHVINTILKETFERKERYFRSNYHIGTRAGEIRWIESLGEVVYDQAGQPVRLIGTAQDCSERVRAQEQIARDRRRLELALEAGELGFWDWNIKTGEVQFGGQWAHMLGYELNEIEPHVRAWERLVHPEDMPAIQIALQRHMEGAAPVYETEHRLKHKNGSWIWVLDRGRIIERDKEGNATRAIGIHANMTFQRAIREQLREADRRKDEFLATLAHELRNPLAPIRTGLAIMKRDPASPTATHAREIMERQLSHMVRLIDDLLDVSRITLGRLQLKKENVELRTVIETAVEASKPAIEAGHHTLEVSLPEEKIWMYADPTRLSQTISNLLNNAAKYTPDHGRIELRARLTNTSLEVAVQDNGLGIPPEMKDQVFQLFGQINRTLDRAQGGLGIGLALVRNLVELHGGTITAESEGQGRGSTFTIALPSSLITSTSLPDRAAVQPTVQGPSQRVLIVDDNTDAAHSLSMLAELLGHSTDVAFTGPEALTKLSSFKPDIIFLDIGLPGMNGFEVVQTIKRLHPHPPPFVVALTGWGTEETKQKGRESGFDEHLTKPVEIATVERILAERSFQARNAA
ncbi:MAG: Autoinducer 2 sensor kinase/phosphatase LuxQ [Pseudomonadota bacterium]